MRFARTLLCLLSFLSIPAFASDPAMFLSPTSYIDATHPAIVERAQKLIAGAGTERERAIRIHDFVRDQIKFGWASAFYDQKASEVMASGVGYCNTKSTLFVALLRAAGIPARQHFVDINTGILADFISPGGAFVDHSYAEVLLDGQWRRVDSYIVDKPLADRARERLAKEGRLLGYGVHRNGVSVWDGSSDAFSQFVNDGTVTALTSQDHGVFDDVGAFYASGRGVNKLNFALRLAFGFFAGSANGKIDSLRGIPASPG